MKRTDLMIIALVLFTAWVFFLLQSAKVEGQTLIAEIYVDGRLVKSVPLPQAGEEEITLAGVGGSNKVVLTSNSARVSWSDCPSQDCVHAFPLEQPGMVIACLPHRVLLRLIGQFVEGEVDVVAK